MASRDELQNSKLFTPLQLGDMKLKHRVIMAPLTRVRSPEHIPNKHGLEYYSQRATNGGFLISEATHISVMGGNHHRAPGIFTNEQIRAWRKITKAVHAKGGYIYCQLWHAGRTTHSSLLGGRTPLCSSATRMENSKIYFTGREPLESEVPREMTIEEIHDTINDYVTAAKNAIAAGFNGIEFHGASGYLIDQFLCDNINVRTDSYGGSPENRARFPLELVDAVVAAIGASRVAIRLSPFSFLHDTAPSNILGDYGFFVSKLDSQGLAYVHMIEPRLSIYTVAGKEKLDLLRKQAMAVGVPESELDEVISLRSFRKLLKNTPFITNGQFEASNCLAPLEEKDGYADAITFGRPFISNPDLPERLRNGWELQPWDESKFYTEGREGYSDYSFYRGKL